MNGYAQWLKWKAAYGLGGHAREHAAMGAGYGSSWVGFGDSVMYNNGGPNIGGGANLYDKGYWTWANAALGGRLTCIRNAGVVGDNTAMMLARLETDVAPYAHLARFCMFNGGVNDPVGGSGTAQTFAQTKSNLTAIIARLRQLFDVVIWHTPTPYAINATVAAQASQIAAWVRATAPTLRGVVLVDNYAKTVNPTATTGDMVTGYSSDSPQLHPNSLGARAIAAECVSIITPLLSASAPRADTQANTVANLTATYATQVLANPLMVTNGGTITGTNVSSAGAGGLAGAPIGYTVRAGTGGSYSDGTTAVTCQLVARSDGYGNDVQLVMAAGANAGTPIIEVVGADYAANVSAGQTIQGVWRLSMSGASGVKKIVLYMTVADGAGGHTLCALTNDGAAFAQSGITDYVFKTTSLTLSGSITGLRLRADLYGTSKDAAATFKLQGSIQILNP